MENLIKLALAKKIHHKATIERFKTKNKILEIFVQDNEVSSCFEKKIVQIMCFEKYLEYQMGSSFFFVPANPLFLEYRTYLKIMGLQEFYVS